MELQELHKRAHALGMDYPRDAPPTLVVRAIQHRQGKWPCCGTDLRYTCTDTDCPWRTECFKLIAEWLR